MRRAARATVLALVIFLAGSLCTWAAVTVLEPAEDPLETTKYTHVSVEEGVVGSELRLNTIASWQTRPIGVSRAQGVITSVDVTAGEQVIQGSKLFSVDLRPVVIAQGDVPAFRSIEAGVEGTDVTQIQQMLADLGFFRGSPTGKAADLTVSAVEAWQRSMGVEPTGVVEAGDVVFVSQLPTRVTLDTEIVKRGASLGGGEEAISGLPSSPSFRIPVTTAQASSIPSGTRVVITAPDQSEWEAVVGDQTPSSDSDSVELHLEGKDGQLVCRDQCDAVPLGSPTTLSSSVVLIEPEEGLVVPSTALVTEANGETGLVSASGERIPVDVKTSADGMAVVSGVEAGQRVRVPGRGADGEEDPAGSDSTGGGESGAE